MVCLLPDGDYDAGHMQAEILTTIEAVIFMAKSSRCEELLAEKLIKSTMLHAGKMLKYQLDEVVLPNGKKANREVIRHPEAVAVVPFLPDGRIVMVRQYRYPVEQALYEIPAGKLDPGEMPDDCVRRELEEETGYSAGKIRRLSSIFTAPGFCDEKIHIYRADDLTAGRQHTDEDEFIQIQPFTARKIRAMIKKGEICDAKTLCGLMLAKIAK